MDESECEKRKAARDEVNNAPYASLRQGDDAIRASHALEYIAAQLWEIRAVLEKLVERDKPEARSKRKNRQPPTARPSPSSPDQGRGREPKSTA